MILMSKVQPIKPSEVIRGKEKNLPDAVLEAFNELIAQNFSGRSATIKQDDVVALMVEKGLTPREIFDKHYLDVEDIYRAVGWVVEYDKPGYNESYHAYFVFKKKRD